MPTNEFPTREQPTVGVGPCPASQAVIRRVNRSCRAERSRRCGIAGGALPPSPYRLLATALACVSLLLLIGCATGRTTAPDQMAVAPRQFPDGILAIMPLGTWQPGYRDIQAGRFHASWLPRVMYGKGEVTTLDDPYEALALAIFNRMRGNNVFKRAFIVKDRAEANILGATHLIAFKISDCYAVGRGANWNFIEWISYEAVLDAHVAVYDLAANQRIQYQHIETRAISTSPWSSPDVRDYLRRKMLEGVACNNTVATIRF